MYCFITIFVEEINNDNDMKTFELKYKSGYKNLQVGDKVNFKRAEENKVYFTVNKGKKEYFLNEDYYNFLKLISINVCNIDTLFLNPEKSEDLHYSSVKNHLNNMTELGLLIYNSYRDADLFISKLTQDDE